MNTFTALLSFSLSFVALVPLCRASLAHPTSLPEMAAGYSLLRRVEVAEAYKKAMVEQPKWSISDLKQEQAERLLALNEILPIGSFSYSMSFDQSFSFSMSFSFPKDFPKPEDGPEDDPIDDPQDEEDPDEDNPEQDDPVGEGRIGNPGEEGSVGSNTVGSANNGSSETSDSGSSNGGEAVQNTSRGAPNQATEGSINNNKINSNDNDKMSSAYIALTVGATAVLVGAAMFVAYRKMSQARAAASFGMISDVSLGSSAV